MYSNGEIQLDIDSGLYSLKEILEMHPEVSAAELMDAYDLSTLISDDWDKNEPRLEKGKNPDFWIEKITRNIERDNTIDRLLEFQEWTVIPFCGNEIIKNLDECIRTIEEIIFNKKNINNR